MAVKTLSLGATRMYELKRDPDKGTPAATRFKIGVLDSRTVGMINDAATTMHVDPKRPDDEIATSINNSERYWKAVEFGLRGWENYQDDKGSHVHFKTVGRRMGGQSYDVVDPELLKLIPAGDLAELAAEILSDNQVSVEEGNV